MAAQPKSRATWGNWFLGLLTDLVLYILFLVVGLTALNVLIQVIVLVVGIAQNADAGNVLTERDGELTVVETGEEGRLAEDSIDLGLAVVQLAVAGAAWWGYRRLRKRFLHLFIGRSFESFVSKRYLVAREGGRLVGLITGVSVLGVAVGVMALIVVISVMEGFDQELVRKFMGVFSHMQVVPSSRYERNTIIPDEISDQIIADALEKDWVEGVAPIFDHEAMVRRGAEMNSITLALFRGIDPEREKDVTSFMEYVDAGEAVPQDGEIVMGRQLARQLGVGPGDTVYSTSAGAQTANGYRPKTTRLKVVGIFQSGLYDVDSKFVYTTIPTVRNMRLADGGVTSVHIRIDAPERVKTYAYDLLENLPNGTGIRTWEMINPEFFKALWMEKVAMFIILLLIVLVAALNIIGTLVMTVVQKTRDIGVLKSMGATNMMILKVFLAYGFLIGLLGTSLGVVWGVRLCNFVHYDIEKIFKLPGAVYGLDRLPVVVDPWLIAFMAACSLLICMLASIIPAYQAARLNPVEALRYD